jgi:hypothetical protein
MLCGQIAEFCYIKASGTYGITGCKGLFLFAVHKFSFSQSVVVKRDITALSGIKPLSSEKTD